MDDDAAALQICFHIDFGESFGGLKTLDDMIGTTAADAVREFQRIKAAVDNGTDLGAAAARFSTFGSAATRELENVRVATNRAEKSAEGMILKLNRQAETFGMNASEIRQYRAEMLAAQADSLKLTDVATRLRAAASEMRRLEAGTVALDTTARKGSGAMTQLSFQLNDVATMAASGAPPFQILATQAGQVVQVFQMAEGGAKGLAAELGAMALRFSPLILGATAAAAGMGLLVRWVNQGVTNDQLTRDLGSITGGANATKQELYKLREETVTWGDVTKAVFREVGKDVAAQFVGDMTDMSGKVKSVLDNMTGQARHDLALIYAGVAGMKSYLGEVEKGGVLGLGKMLVGQGDPKLLEKTFGAAYDQADQYLGKLGARVKKAAVENARQRIADGVGFNNPAKPKTDKHAEQLERESRAIEAQIRNLYGLADAYGVSGAAALIAEARVKAESEAIKKRGDIEARVDQQIRLSIAQRVSDASKSAAAMRDEASVQAEINAQVAGGLVPAERAGELVRQRMAELPLLAAIEAAQQRGLTAEVKKATDALNEQQTAQAKVDAARKGAFYAAADQDGDRRLHALREEARLLGATDEERARGNARIRAEQEILAQGFALNDAYAKRYIDKQVEIAGNAELNAQAQRNLNDELTFAADKWDLIARNVQSAASGMADAFGGVGRAIGDVAAIYANFQADRERLDVQHDAALAKVGSDQAAQMRANTKFALASATAQVGMFGDMTSAAKGFFKEGSDGYQALAAAEKTFRAIEFAMSVRAMAQDAIETASSVAKSGVRAAAHAAEAVAKAIASLPFPLNIAAGAATAAVLSSIGIAIGGAFGGEGKNNLEKPNTGTGTVLGDGKAQSESLRLAIDQLREVDTLTNTFARQMAGSLRSIDSQIGGLAAVLVRSGNISADSKVAEGFKPNLIGSVLGKIPLVGGLLGSLFGSKTSVIASGLFGGAQSIGQILAGGFDASTYSDVEKKKKFFGITTGKSYSTQFGEADAALEQQFTLILRSFATAVSGAAEPLGQATDAIEQRLNGFVVNIGKIDLKGLTGAEIQEKLEAVFGAAADSMANAAFPGIERFQEVGEGAFETLVRVASTAEAVTNALDQMGDAAREMSLEAKLGLADQFETIGDLTNAIGEYFEAFYTPAEQLEARTEQLARVFDDLGFAIPDTLAAFRDLVDAQDLNTSAGQAAYATLIQLAPAFAELQKSLAGAKSAADVAAERADLERQLLELRGDTAALRALELGKLDASNRDLQKQVYALQDAKEAAAAADQLRQAWQSVGDGIMEEVKRIRGITGAETGGFAALLGRFNAANAAARGGDLDAAKSLPQLSQALLTAAAEAATSRQELDRVRAQTASTLEATYSALGGAGSATSAAALLTGASNAQAAATAPAANDDAAAELREIRAELAAMRADNNAGHAATAGNTGRMARKLDEVTAGGDAIMVVQAA